MFNISTLFYCFVKGDGQNQWILTFVPTKVAVSTSLLSKRWEFLWTWVPKLEFVDNKYVSDLARMFLARFLSLN